MEKPVYLTLPENVLSELSNLSRGNMSNTIRDMLQDYDSDDVVRFLDTGRTGVRLDRDMDQKLKAEAEHLGVATSKLIKAIIESKLAKMHHH